MTNETEKPTEEITVHVDDMKPYANPNCKLCWGKGYVINVFHGDGMLVGKTTKAKQVYKIYKPCGGKKCTIAKMRSEGKVKSLTLTPPEEPVKK